MLAKIESLDEAAAQGKRASVAAGFLLMVTVFEAALDLMYGQMPLPLLMFAVAQAIGLGVLMWRVWSGTSVLGAAFLLPWAPLLAVLVWPNVVWVFFCMWGMWDAANGLHGALAYQRLAAAS